ncbi:sodium-dependent transporter [Sphingorhabdus soli]|uniref:Transporter n=1 Tax=Flavisphingopyxis soli TaxID=2601267 RepID=A0A5C6UNS4_9SPHN|nr:sodium-dependent transporter [Sphingorhabdus soli]TXC73771.1 sodium-dependent transporter [Sphingorhabdus soli]
MTDLAADQPEFRWSSRLSFVLVASGFAVGLGNIWRFPYMTGENGGAAFLLIYLACAFGIGVPLIMAELMLGRRGKKGIVGSIRAVAAESKASRGWSWIGIFALTATFAILVYYVVIAGWTLDYIVRSGAGSFADMRPAQSIAAFDALMASPGRMIFWGACVVVMMALVVGKGLKNGIEKVTTILMPVFFAGLVLLSIYAMIVGDMGQAVRFLFFPDFSKIDGNTVIMAVGQAFFSVGVGFGTMVSFGGYLDKDTSIAGVAGTIVAADTGVALLAGLTIFPFVFQYGLEIASGPGLVFETLPVAFGAMPGGSLVGVAFFLLLFLAAITSCIGLLEPLVSYTIEKFGMTRPIATAILGGLIWVLGFATVFSFNHWDDLYPLAWTGMFADSTIYIVQDMIAVNFILPVGALLTAIFMGWITHKDIWRNELSSSSRLVQSLWLFAVRFVAPVTIILILAFAYIG